MQDLRTPNIQVHKLSLSSHKRTWIYFTQTLWNEFT